MFETIYHLAFDGGINQNFFMVMVTIFLISLLCLIFKKWLPFIDYTPSLLTSIGIFGTFLGIFLGLLEFNPATIDKSIETLLTGLKTAFVTSLIGLVLSMIFKTIHTLFESRHKTLEGEVRQEEITPTHIYQILKTQSTILEKISQSLVADSEHSMVGQLRLLRQEAQDHQHKNTAQFTAFEDKLWIKFNEFMTILSKSATETIIDALKTVIEDFNQNLTEQFGENFKHLNEAVFKLVTWQDNNLQEMTRLLTLHQLNSQSVESIAGSTQAIVHSMSEALTTSQSFESTLQVNQHQIDELANHLETFALMRDKAVEAVPVIQSQIESITGQLVDGAAVVNQSMQAAASQLSESSVHIAGQLTHASESARQLTSHFHITMNDMILELDSTLKTAVNQFESSQNKLSELITTNTDAILKEVESHTKLNVDKTTQAMNVQFVTFENVMQTLLMQLESTHQAILKDFELSQDSISQSVKIHTQNVLAQIESQVISSVSRTNEVITHQATVFDTATQKVVTQLDQTIRALVQEIETAQTNMSRSLSSHTDMVLGGVETQIKTSVDRTQEAVNAQLRLLDQGLEQALNKALEDLGSALGTIAEHLLTTYNNKAK